MFQFTTLPPLSLYIHLPWCVRKCPYCDFNSHAPREGEPLPERAYVEALLRDVECELPLIWGRSIESVFIGGGTPSLFSAEALDALLSGLRARLRLLPGIEITLEANPGTVEAGRFAEYRALGINRLSIGVQSFDDERLRALGRIHGGREAILAAEVAHAAGFDNFNLDLMFGLPGQTLNGALADLEQGLALCPTHLSWYQLTLEPNTLFHARPPVLPDDERIADMQEAGVSRLAEAGFAPYEVSAYAREGRRCRHNLNYWEFGDYLGIGAGAHGKLTLPAEQRIIRRARLRSPEVFMARAGQAAAFEEQSVNWKEAPFEFMLNALRLHEGFPSALFQERTGLPISVVRQALEKAEAKGLIDWQLTHIRPTVLGARFLNDVITLFLPER